jgi:hypothetical protein
MGPDSWKIGKIKIISFPYSKSLKLNQAPQRQAREKKEKVKAEDNQEDPKAKKKADNLIDFDLSERVL